MFIQRIFYIQQMISKNKMGCRNVISTSPCDYRGSHEPLLEIGLNYVPFNITIY